MIGGQPGGRLLTKRGLISTAAGIVLSLLGLALAKLGHGNTWWSDILILPGFFVAAFTPFFGVHSNNPGSIYLMLGANAFFYGLLAYGCYPIIARLRTSK